MMSRDLDDAVQALRAVADADEDGGADSGHTRRRVLATLARRQRTGRRLTAVGVALALSLSGSAAMAWRSGWLPAAWRAIRGLPEAVVAGPAEEPGAGSRGSTVRSRRARGHDKAGGGHGNRAASLADDAVGAGFDRGLGVDTDVAMDQAGVLFGSGSEGAVLGAWMHTPAVASVRIAATGADSVPLAVSAAKRPTQAGADSDPDPDSDSVSDPDSDSDSDPESVQLARPTAKRPTQLAAAQPTAKRPTQSDAELFDYRVAHALHFQQRDPHRALVAWEHYLARWPGGRLAIEARYNRALTLVRLGRRADAIDALRPFADGHAGGYRRSEAARLLHALTGAADRP